MQDRPLQSQSETVRIPIYGEERFITDSLSGFDMEQQFINCYPQISQDPVTGEKTTTTIKRPGNAAILSIKTAVGAGAAADIHVKEHIVITQLIDVFIVAAFDSVRAKTYIVQYRPITGTATLLGDIGTTAWIDPIHITEYQQVSSGVLYPAVAICWKKADESVSRCYTVRSDGTVFTTTSVTQITDTGFPDQQTPARICTGPFQQMNGLIYIMCTDGTIANSGGASGTPNDASSASMWNTLSVIKTYQSPDKGLGVYRYKHHLIAVGKDSIEFFNDIGNPPPASSLERTEQAFIKFGAPTSKAVINVADTLYWIAYGSNNTLGLWKMEGYTPVKVSRSKQDFEITNGFHASTNINTIDLVCIVINGKVNIGINNVPTYNMLWRQTAGWGDQTNDYWHVLQTPYCGIAYTLLYNSNDDLWWSWSCMGDATSRVVPAVAYPSTAASATIAYHYTQYFFYDPNPITNWSTGTPPQVVEACTDYVLKLREGDQYNYEFMVDKYPAGTDRPICASVQFNTFTFGNQKRKKINKLNLIFSHNPANLSSISPAGTISHGTEALTYSITLLYRRGNTTSDPQSNIQRYISFPQSQGRYYFNNLGSARMWSFCVASLTRDSFGLQAVELDVEQNEH